MHDNVELLKSTHLWLFVSTLIRGVDGSWCSLSCVLHGIITIPCYHVLYQDACCELTSAVQDPSHKDLLVSSMQCVVQALQQQLDEVQQAAEDSSDLQAEAQRLQQHNQDLQR